MSFGELLSGTPSFLTLSTFADSAIWEQWGKCCLKSCNCPVCFVSPQNGPWLCQKEALELSKWDLGSWEGHVCHGPFSSFKHGSVSGYKAWQTESWANIVVCNNAIGAKLDWHGFPLSWFFFVRGSSAFFSYFAKTATCTNNHPSPESCWKDKSLHLIFLRLSGSDFIELFGPPAAWANARQELTGNLELLLLFLEVVTSNVKRMHVPHHYSCSS